MGTTVSIDDVVGAFELGSDETSSYVNRVTGEVLTLTSEILAIAEEGPVRKISDWEEEAVAEAKQVLESDDWLELPSNFELHEWKIMDEFGRSLLNEEHRQAIAGAIRGSGAFRNFKATVRRLGIEPAWFAFKTRALETIARDWLMQHGLVPSPAK